MGFEMKPSLAQFGKDGNYPENFFYHNYFESSIAAIFSYFIINHGNADSEGSIPLWDAIMGGHKSVIKLLRDNGAMISAGDVSSYACAAIEQNKLEVLKEIVKCGGDVTQPTNIGTTPLHVAVSEGNIDIVRFLLDQGANIDRPDMHGWTPRNLADHQGHEDIIELFQNIKDLSKPPALTSIPGNQSFRQHTGSWNPAKGQGGMPRLAKYSSEPTMPLPLGKYSSDPSVPPFVLETLPPLPEGNWSESRRRRKANNFQNSLFGIMQSAANTGTIYISLSSGCYLNISIDD